MIALRAAAALAAALTLGAGAGAAQAAPKRLLTPTFVCVPEFNHPFSPQASYWCIPRGRQPRLRQPGIDVLP